MSRVGSNFHILGCAHVCAARFNSPWPRACPGASSGIDASGIRSSSHLGCTMLAQSAHAHAPHTTASALCPAPEHSCARLHQSTHARGAQTWCICAVVISRAPQPACIQRTSPSSSLSSPPKASSRVTGPVGGGTVASFPPLARFPPS